MPELDSQKITAKRHIALQTGARSLQQQMFPIRHGWITKRLVPIPVSLALLGASLESVESAEPSLPPITAEAAIVIDRDNGSVLGVKNPDLGRGMGSTTKIMVALLALERNGSNIDVMVGPISANAASRYGTAMNLNAGDRVSLREE